MRSIIVGAMASGLLAILFLLFVAGAEWPSLGGVEKPPDEFSLWGLITAPLLLHAAEIEDDGENTDPPGEVIADAQKEVAFGGVLEIAVLGRKEDVINDYPCSRCHDEQAPDPEVRDLEDEHRRLVFNHGADRFWCLTCHGSPDKDMLTSRNGAEIDFDAAYRLCGECHYDRERDWAHGAHGKRVGAWSSPDAIPLKATELAVSDRNSIGHWRGERYLLNCTECHNPHDPKMGPFTPSPPPPVRAGLTRPIVSPAHSEPIWTLGKHLAPVGPGDGHARELP